MTSDTAARMGGTKRDNRTFGSSRLLYSGIAAAIAASAARPRTATV
jgi:hypothetical protein